MQFIPLKPTAAALLGAAVGIASSYVVLFISGLVFVWALVWSGVPENESYARAYESTAYLAFAHALGFVCMLPGGLWAARFSERAHTRNAAIAGLLVALFALTANLVPYYLPVPLWSKVASTILPIPAFMLGAAFHRNGGAANNAV
ncbi:hypothetical protein [Roseateles sp.]|uniref:hypothetical protein n=1 Tax=Roseateles sp. TaxID=1971397 RepID=UPI002E09F39E|nr:hypothetical protein [Roseateles sp.]